jgi:hypothetical protein
MRARMTSRDLAAQNRIAQRVAVEQVAGQETNRQAVSSTVGIDHGTSISTGGRNSIASRRSEGTPSGAHARDHNPAGPGAQEGLDQRRQIVVVDG